MCSPLKLILSSYHTLLPFTKLSLVQHQTEPVLRLPHITKVVHKQSSHCCGWVSWVPISLGTLKDPVLSWWEGLALWNRKIQNEDGEMVLPTCRPQPWQSWPDKHSCQQTLRGASLWVRISLAALHGPCCFLWDLSWANCSKQIAAHSKENLDAIGRLWITTDRWKFHSRSSYVSRV